MNVDRVFVNISWFMINGTFNVVEHGSMMRFLKYEQSY